MNIGPDRLPYVEDKRWTIIYHFSFHVQWRVVIFLSKRLKTCRLYCQHFSLVLDILPQMLCIYEIVQLLLIQFCLCWCSLVSTALIFWAFRWIIRLQSSACTRSRNNTFLLSCLNYICDPPHVYVHVNWHNVHFHLTSVYTQDRVYIAPSACKNRMSLMLFSLRRINTIIELSFRCKSSFDPGESVCPQCCNVTPQCTILHIRRPDSVLIGKFQLVNI